MADSGTGVMSGKIRRSILAATKPNSTISQGRSFFTASALSIVIAPVTAFVFAPA